MGAALAVGAGAALVGGGLSAWGASKQEKAAKDAAKQSAEAIKEGQSKALDYTKRGSAELRVGRDRAMAETREGFGQASQLTGQGYGNALSQLGQGYAAAGQQLQQGMQPVLGLQQFADPATQAIAQRDITQQGPLASLMSGQTFGGFQADPGYQFRQQQGEQAIQRAAAASGGRLSGRTLQSLANFNQGLASQEFGNFAQRRLAETGQAANVLQAQAGLETQAGLAAQSNQARLAELGYGGQQQLAGGLSALAAQRGQGLSALEAQRGTALGNIAGQQGSALSQLQFATGQADLNAFTNLASLAAGGGAQQAQAAQSVVPYQGQALGAAGANLAGFGGQVGNALLYSQLAGG